MRVARGFLGLILLLASSSRSLAGGPRPWRPASLVVANHEDVGSLVGQGAGEITRGVSAVAAARAVEQVRRLVPRGQTTEVVVVYTTPPSYQAEGLDFRFLKGVYPADSFAMDSKEQRRLGVAIESRVVLGSGEDLARGAPVFESFPVPEAALPPAAPVPSPSPPAVAGEELRVHQGGAFRVEGQGVDPAPDPWKPGPRPSSMGPDPSGSPEKMLAWNQYLERLSSWRFEELMTMPPEDLQVHGRGTFAGHGRLWDPALASDPADEGRRLEPGELKVRSEDAEAYFAPGGVLFDRSIGARLAARLDLSGAELDPETGLLWVDGSSTSAGLDMDLLATTLRLALEGGEPYFSLDPWEPDRREREVPAGMLDPLMEPEILDRIWSQGFAFTSFEGDRLRAMHLAAAAPRLEQALWDDGIFAQRLVFDPPWLAGTRLGEALFRADLVLKEFWAGGAVWTREPSRPLRVPGSPGPKSLESRGSGAVTIEVGGLRMRAAGFDATRWWFVPGGERAEEPGRSIHLGDLQPSLRIRGTLEGKDVVDDPVRVQVPNVLGGAPLDLVTILPDPMVFDASLGPRERAVMREIEDRFDAYAAAVPEWRLLSEIFRVWVLGVWLAERLGPAEARRVAAGLPRPLPPTRPLPDRVDDPVVVHVVDGGGRGERWVSVVGGIGFAAGGILRGSPLSFSRRTVFPSRGTDSLTDRGYQGQAGWRTRTEVTLGLALAGLVRDPTGGTPNWLGSPPPEARRDLGGYRAWIERLQRRSGTPWGWAWASLGALGLAGAAAAGLLAGLSLRWVPLRTGREEEPPPWGVRGAEIVGAACLGIALVVPYAGLPLHLGRLEVDDGRLLAAYLIMPCMIAGIPGLAGALLAGLVVGPLMIAFSWTQSGPWSAAYLVQGMILLLAGLSAAATRGADLLGGCRRTLLAGAITVAIGVAISMDSAPWLGSLVSIPVEVPATTETVRDPLEPLAPEVLFAWMARMDEVRVSAGNPRFAWILFAWLGLSAAGVLARRGKGH